MVTNIMILVLDPDENYKKIINSTIVKNIVSFIAIFVVLRFYLGFYCI
jgi:hypothetical protein